jgi:hypothetical protein
VIIAVSVLVLFGPCNTKDLVMLQIWSCNSVAVVYFAMFVVFGHELKRCWLQRHCEFV